jgi:hypothetical protein
MFAVAWLMNSRQVGVLSTCRWASSVQGETLVEVQNVHEMANPPSSVILYGWSKSTLSVQN